MESVLPFHTLSCNIIKFKWLKSISGLLSSRPASTWRKRLSALFATRSKSSSLNRATCTRLRLLWSFAAMFMDNFSMCLNCSRWEDSCLGVGTYSLGISWTEVTTPCRRFSFCSAIRWSIPKKSSCWGEIMSLGKSPLFMGFTMKSLRSTAARLPGSILMRPLITFL